MNYKRLSVASVISAAITVPLVISIQSCQPKLVQSLSNPQATVVAHVYRYGAGTSFDDDEYAVDLKALPEVISSSNFEVVVIEAASFKGRRGPQISWQNSSTLVIKFDEGRPFFSTGESFAPLKNVYVKRGTGNVKITAKIIR